MRYAYFARHVRPDDLSRAGQLSSAAGLVGGLVGPVTAAVVKNSFFWAAITAAIAHGVCALALAVWLPQPKKRAAAWTGGEGGEGGMSCCERCGADLADKEKAWGTQLCDS